MVGINAVQITDSSMWWKRKKTHQEKAKNKKQSKPPPLIGLTPRWVLDEIFHVFLPTDLIILYDVIKPAKNPPA